jgi:hypothetical protein
MTKMDKSAASRALLASGGALVVSIGMPMSLDTLLAVSQAHAQGAKPSLAPTYIAVNADDSVSAFFGKMDMGQGLFVSIGQMVAEELDVPLKAVKVIMGDTATSVNQGGASGSTGIQFGGKQMRMAAAEARRVLVDMAAQKLSLPADQLTVTDGVVHAKIDTGKRATYAELIGGRYFNVQLEWNKEIGNALYAPGKAQPKKPSEYKIVASDQNEYCAEGVANRTCHRRLPVSTSHDPASHRRAPPVGSMVIKGIPALAWGQRLPRRGCGPSTRSRRQKPGRMVELRRCFDAAALYDYIQRPYASVKN